MIQASNFKITIENPKGSYKSFELDDESSYPLKGVTYPVDYGCIEGYEGEDEDSLDIFVGTGDIQGYIQVWRPDLPQETKFFIQMSQDELKNLEDIFKPVLLDMKNLDEEAFMEEIKKYKIS